MTFGELVIILVLVFPFSVFVSVRLFYKAKRISRSELNKEQHAQDSTETREV